MPARTTTTAPTVTLDPAWLFPDDRATLDVPDDATESVTVPAAKIATGLAADLLESAHAHGNRGAVRGLLAELTRRFDTE